MSASAAAPVSLSAARRVLQPAAAVGAVQPVLLPRVPAVAAGAAGGPVSHLSVSLAPRLRRSGGRHSELRLRGKSTRHRRLFYGSFHFKSDTAVPDPLRFSMKIGISIVSHERSVYAKF